MILGIAFLGEGRRPIRSQFVVGAAFMAGCLAGGMASAAGLWIAVTPVRTMLPLVAVQATGAVVAVAAMVLSVRGKRLWRAGLVPSTWPHRFGELRGWGLLGFVLGGGLGSYAVTTLTYVAFLSPALLLSFPAALGAGAAFGGVRALVAIVGSLSPDRFGWALFRSGVAPRVARHVATTACGAVALAICATAIP